MKTLNFINLLSVFLTIVCLFIVYSSLFTDLYRHTFFSLWYWPGALILFFTLMFNALCLLLNSKIFLNIFLFITNIVLLTMFTLPFFQI